MVVVRNAVRRVSARAAVPIVAVVLLAVGALSPVAATASGPGLTVSGNLLLQDGAPFLPHGFNMIALLTPDWCARSATQGARDHFGQAEMDAAHAWNADTLRFQVSQRGLADATVPQADRDAYLAKVVAGVALARDNGFVVIVSMQDQGNGCGAVHPLPSAETVNAWTVLAPALMADPDVAFELFNEPQNQADAAGWAQWQSGGSTPDPNLGDVAVGHQSLVDRLRALGSTNVLIVDAARLGELTSGMPRLSDPVGNVVYGIHPYVYRPAPSRWDEQYGAAAAEVPLIATEWNYLAADCRTADEQLAPDLLVYLRRHHIGVLGHAFDALRTTIADWTWRPTQCGTATGGSGQVLQSFFAGLAGTDVVPPSAPDGLLATDIGAAGVTLAWTPPVDDVARYEVVRDGAVLGASAAPGWSDATVSSGTTYAYTVRSVDAEGNVSGNALAIEVTTPLPPPPSADVTAPTAPGSPTARVVSPSQVMVRWGTGTDNVAVTGYRLSRDGLVVATGTALSFTDNAATAGSHTYTVEALDAAGNVSPASSTGAVVPAAAPRGLTGTYFDTATLSTQRLVRTDPAVSFGWGTGRPATGVGADTFSARWTGRLLPTASGSHTFYVSSDEGARLWIDGVLIVDDWTAHRSRETPGTVTLTADRAHDITLEYYDRSGTASVKLSWSGPGFGKQIVPAAQLLSR